VPFAPAPGTPAPAPGTPEPAQHFEQWNLDNSPDTKEPP
jgi:hypothetical protein